MAKINHEGRESDLVNGVYRVVGTMSGTSCDGLDVVMIEVSTFDEEVRWLAIREFVTRGLGLTDCGIWDQQRRPMPINWSSNGPNGWAINWLRWFENGLKNLVLFTFWAFPDTRGITSQGGAERGPLATEKFCSSDWAFQWWPITGPQTSPLEGKGLHLSHCLMPRFFPIKVPVSIWGASPTSHFCPAYKAMLCRLQTSAVQTSCSIDNPSERVNLLTWVGVERGPGAL